MFADQALASLRIETVLTPTLQLAISIRLSRACGLKQVNLWYYVVAFGSGSREPADWNKCMISDTFNGRTDQALASLRIETIAAGKEREHQKRSGSREPADWNMYFIKDPVNAIRSGSREPADWNIIGALAAMVLSLIRLSRACGLKHQ